jgi:hypothetical protein
MISKIGVVCATALCALACSSSAGPPVEAGSFPETAYATATSDGMKLVVEVRTAPQPPVAGMNEAELVVSDSRTGQGVDGLSLGVVPWMPAMGHGTSIVPSVTAQGNGRYLVTNLSLFMPGTWELRTTVTGPVSDHVAPAFQVP